jgi:hypothetical protein
MKLREILGGFGGLNNGIGIPDSLNKITAYCNELRQ